MSVETAIRSLIREEVVARGASAPCRYQPIFGSSGAFAFDAETGEIVPMDAIRHLLPVTRSDELRRSVPETSPVQASLQGK
jgi:hypothetical protein